MKIKIYTSYYDAIEKIDDEYTLVSISGDGGKIANFSGKVYKKLAPKYDFWKTWHDNIGKVSKEENREYYIKNYYNQVLDNLNQNEVIADLMKFGSNVVLLCYEKPTEFCHRHIVADWFKKIGLAVEEIIK